MRRSHLLALCSMALVGLSSCEILDIVAPATAHSGENISVRVTLGIAENDTDLTFCMQAPIGWTHGTPHYTITGAAPSNGSLTTLNAGGATSYETMQGRPGYTWTCFDGPVHAEGDRGEVEVGFTVGTPGTYVLRFGLRTTVSQDTASHTIVVDAVPRYDANAKHEALPANVTSIAFGNDVFVMAASSGQTIVDANGTRTTHDAGAILRDIAFGAGKFIVVGADKTIKSSTDGKTWSAPLVPNVLDADLNVVFRGATRFIAAGAAGIILESTDGVAWTAAPSTGLGTTTVWQHGAASATADVLVDDDGLLVAVSDNGGPFQLRALPADESIGGVAYASATGWVFVRVGGYMQSPNLVDTTIVPLGESFNPSAAFAALGSVYLGSIGRIQRIAGTELIEVGTNSSVSIRDGVDDGRRLLMTGSLDTGRLYTVELPRLAVDATTLAFTAVGEQRTLNVRNDGLGALYVTGVSASGGATVVGCENAVLATASTCVVTVTLTDGANPGTVLVSSNGVAGASQTVALTFTPAPDDSGGQTGDGDTNAKEDDGCAALPGAPLGLVLALLALRRRGRAT